jgi:hypothetical protein
LRLISSGKQINFFIEKSCSVGYTFGWLYKGCANSADEAHFQFLIEFSWRLMFTANFFLVRIFPTANIPCEENPLRFSKRVAENTESREQAEQRGCKEWMDKEDLRLEAVLENKKLL